MGFHGLQGVTLATFAKGNLDQLKLLVVIWMFIGEIELCFILLQLMVSSLISTLTSSITLTLISRLTTKSHSSVEKLRIWSCHPWQLKLRRNLICLREVIGRRVRNSILGWILKLVLLLRPMYLLTPRRILIWSFD